MQGCGETGSLRALGLAAPRPLFSLQEAGEELQGAKEDAALIR